MIELAYSSQCIRKAALELLRRQGEGAITFAEWKALVLADSGRSEEAKHWMIIAGTLQAMIEK